MSQKSNTSYICGLIPVNLTKNMKKRLIISALIACFLCTYAFSQQGSVRGNVYDKSTGEPIAYGTVQIQGTTLGTATDLDGFFSITNVEPGNYVLVANYLGYDSSAVDIKIVQGGITYKSLYLDEAGIELETVQVSAEKAEARTEVKVSTVTISPKQITALPSIGGEPDIAQYLPVLPGVIFTGDQGGQLYIRGGSPIQNKILLDGMTIYNPFHSIGFFSVFETETIRNVDVLTGGFNAEYGGRISAIVDIKTREGNKKRFGGIVSANPFQSKILVEGPLKKLADEGGGSSSFILTGKRSYIDETSRFLYSYAVDTALYNRNVPPAERDNNPGLPFNFTDLYGKLSFVSANGSKFNLFGFNFEDNVDFVGVADLNWQSTGGGMNFKLIPPTSTMIIGGTIGFSDYSISLEEGDGRPRSSSITTFLAGLDFTYFGNNNEVKYGIEINGFSTDFIFQNLFDNTIQQENFTTEIAAFVKYRQAINKLVIEPSLRVQYYASLPEWSVEPRIGLKYNITDNLRFKFAGGLFSQNLLSTVNEEDVVNLFVGFLSGPEETIFKPGTREPTNSRLQKAIHGIAGFEIDLTRKLELNVEPYYKDFTQLITVNRTKQSEEDPDFATETGEAYGLDFSLKYQTSTLYLWTTYSLGYVRRFDGVQTFPTIFDRRHNVNFLVTYNFGGFNEWEASARWNMGSGFPFTLTQGFYSRYDFDDGVGVNPLQENADLGIIFSDERNSGRLPYYHRLDLSLKRKFDFGKYRDLEIVASVTNAYDRENIFFFDRVRYERVNQLPILPSLGIIFDF